MYKKADIVNRSFLGDCLKILPKFPDKCFDMIFADLPYGTTNCAWDCPIDLALLWKQYRRVIKDNGAILLFAQTPFDKVLGCSNLQWLRYEWIWEKPMATGFLNANKMPLKAHENILVFYKKAPTYNIIKTNGHRPVNKVYRRAEVFNRSEIYGKIKTDSMAGGNTDRYPRSIQIFSADTQAKKHKKETFPTQKPVALLSYYIKIYTNEGDLILDNTAGSGSTGEAAYINDRMYTMIDKSPAQYRKMIKREAGFKNTILSSVK